MLTDVLNVLGFDASALANDYHAIVHRAVAVLPPGGGNAATGRWQCCHWAVAMLPPSGVRWKILHEETGKPMF